MPANSQTQTLKKPKITKTIQANTKNTTENQQTETLSIISKTNSNKLINQQKPTNQEQQNTITINKQI